MYKAFSPSIIKEMEKNGNITLTVKPGWDGSNDWCAKPFYISYWLGGHHERIFTCYLSKESDVIQITSIEATNLIADKKALVDAYMYIALKGLIDFAETSGVKRLIVDSFIPALADHMLDLGFYVTPKGLSNGSRGCKILKE